MTPRGRLAVDCAVLAAASPGLYFALKYSDMAGVGACVILLACAVIDGVREAWRLLRGR